MVRKEEAPASPSRKVAPVEKTMEHTDQAGMQSLFWGLSFMPSKDERADL